MKILRITGLLLLLLTLTAFALPAPAPLAVPQPLGTDNKLDQEVLLRYRWLRDTELPQVLAWLRERRPCLAAAVVKDGKALLTKSYGVRSLATKEPVDANTLFGIASNTTAFTTAALGLLVNEGKLRWDDELTDHIPEFKRYDPYARAEFTVRDLLTHRSGLPPYAGDLMQWPDSTTFTLPEILHNLRYLKPATSFRTQYAYNNMYLLAGELVRHLAGQSWNDFVAARLLRLLGMTQ